MLANLFCQTINVQTKCICKKLFLITSCVFNSKSNSCSVVIFSFSDVFPPTKLIDCQTFLKIWYSIIVFQELFSAGLKGLAFSWLISNDGFWKVNKKYF